ncbi:DUF2752 domain-containing protein [Nostoc sp.]|uniref:DUF2752 domain-containing protein n=1 Tax=Nostoc sp. TaxID=1180 RepID=UPI003FA5D8A3
MFELFSYPLTYQGKLVRWGLLGFSCTPLLRTYFYHQGHRVRFLVCPIRHLTGIPCPTCGMACSFMAIAKEIWFKQWQKIYSAQFCLLVL